MERTSFGSADRTEGLSDNGIKVEPEHSEDWELPDEIDLMYEPDLPINSQVSTRLPRWTEIGQTREAEAPGGSMNPYHFADVIPIGPEPGMSLPPLNTGETLRQADESGWNMAQAPRLPLPTFTPPPTTTHYVTMEPPTSFSFTPVNRPEAEPLLRSASLTVTPSRVLYDGSRIPRQLTPLPTIEETMRRLSVDLAPNSHAFAGLFSNATRKELPPLRPRAAYSSNPGQASGSQPQPQGRSGRQRTGRQKKPQAIAAFGPTMQHRSLYDSTRQKVTVKLSACLSSGVPLLFQNNAYITYRRNYVDVGPCQYELKSSLQPEHIDRHLYLRKSKTGVSNPAPALAMVVVAMSCLGNQSRTELLVHTRTRLPTGPPTPVNMRPWIAESDEADCRFASSTGEEKVGCFGPFKHHFERLQFGKATRHNGARRTEQEYFMIKSLLLAYDPFLRGPTQWVTIASCTSPRIMVRGRSPRNFEPSRKKKRRRDHYEGDDEGDDRDSRPKPKKGTSGTSRKSKSSTSVAIAPRPSRANQAAVAVQPSHQEPLSGTAMAVEAFQGDRVVGASVDKEAFPQFVMTDGVNKDRNNVDFRGEPEGPDISLEFSQEFGQWPHFDMDSDQGLTKSELDNLPERPEQRISAPEEVLADEQFDLLMTGGNTSPWNMEVDVPIKEDPDAHSTLCERMSANSEPAVRAANAQAQADEERLLSPVDFEDDTHMAS